MSEGEFLTCCWRRVSNWLDRQPGEEEARELPRRMIEPIGQGPLEGLSHLPLREELALLELALLEQLAGEAEADKGDPLWFRLRVQHWRDRPDGGELVLERLPRGVDSRPSTEFCEPLSAGQEASTASAVLSALLRESGRCEEPLLRELLVGPLAVGLCSWIVQATLERVASQLLFGEREGREILVGYDGGPALALGLCTADAWYRDAIMRLG